MKLSFHSLKSLWVRKYYAKPYTYLKSFSKAYQGIDQILLLFPDLIFVQTLRIMVTFFYHFYIQKYFWKVQKSDLIANYYIIVWKIFSWNIWENVPSYWIHYFVISHIGLIKFDGLVSYTHKLLLQDTKRFSYFIH